MGKQVELEDWVADKQVQVECVACNGTGVASNGTPCVACRPQAHEPAKKKKTKKKRTRKKKEPQRRGYIVRVEANESARKLVTFRPPDDGPIESPEGSALQGAIVRIVPKADATDEQIAGLEAGAYAAGALTVKALPRESKAAVVVRQRRKLSDDERSRTPRQVVMHLAEKSNSGDRKALGALLEEVIDEEGL